MSDVSSCSACFVLFCVCYSLYESFCHGALEIDMSTLFTTFVLCTSLQFILHVCHVKENDVYSVVCNKLFVNDIFKML